MKHLMKALPIFLLFGLIYSNPVQSQSMQELPLWPDGIPDNPIIYTQEKVRSEGANESSPSGMNRVFSQVSEPTYVLYQAEKNIANGVAVVICPGGGFRDVWIDREGTDFALWLAQKGITSLVLKYRTFNPDAEGFSLERETYNREVYADALQAIHILRSQATELNIDLNKIGIAGYSAGGALALMAALEIYEDSLPEYTSFKENTLPDFACLIYPGVDDAFLQAIKTKDQIPPMFMINGAEDDVTPANKCIELYSALLEKKIPAELHIYAKGRHGFDSGIGRGFGVASWQDSFILWLKDIKIQSNAANDL
jgi:acetyl esterase/lipase